MLGCLKSSKLWKGPPKLRPLVVLLWICGPLGGLATSGNAEESLSLAYAMINVWVTVGILVYTLLVLLVLLVAEA